MNFLAHLSIKALFTGLLAFVVTSWLLTLFTPGIMTIFLVLLRRSELSERLATIVVIVLSLTLSGYVTARVATKEALLHGLALGVIIALFNLTLYGFESWFAIVVYGLILASPVVGAYVWLRRKPETPDEKKTPFLEQGRAPRKTVSKKIVWAIIGAAVALPIIIASSSFLWEQSDIARQKMAFSPMIALMNGLSALVVTWFLNAPFRKSDKNHDRFDTGRLHASIGGVALFFVAIFCTAIFLSPDRVGPLTGVVLPFFLALSLFSFITGYGIGWIAGKLIKRPLNEVEQGTSK